MAYSLPRKKTCQTSGCTKTATRTVYSTFNQKVGHYCTRCAYKKVQVLQQLEREERAREVLDD